MNSQMWEQWLEWGGGKMENLKFPETSEKGETFCHWVRGWCAKPMEAVWVRGRCAKPMEAVCLRELLGPALLVE